MNRLGYLKPNGNLYGLVVIRQIDNSSPGGGGGGGVLEISPTRDANLDTQSSDISAEEIREPGRSFQSLKVSLILEEKFVFLSPRCERSSL